MPIPRVLQFPGQLRYYHEDVFLDELRPFGMSKRRFRTWLRALSVPFLELGSHRYVEHMAFALALRAATRIGSIDHTTPGSASRKKLPLPPPPTPTTDLAPIIAEMLAAARLPNMRASKSEITKAARRAAAVLLQSGYTSLAPTLQNESTYDQIKRAVNLGVFDNDDPSSPSPDAASPPAGSAP